MAEAWGFYTWKEENSDHLAYWLSKFSTLLFMLQKSLIAGPRKPPTPTLLLGMMTQSFRSSSAYINVDALDVVRQVEAKCPALLFKQQLTAYVEKIYGIIRDNAKKELTSLLSSCIQAPRTTKVNVLKGSGNSIGNQTQSSPWQSIIKSLNNLLKTLQENYVPQILIQKIISQVFSFINVQLFNRIVFHRMELSKLEGVHLMNQASYWRAHASNKINWG